MNRIKLLREEKNVYQKDLAQLLGVSVPAINYYENEKRAMDTDTAMKLADYFGVSIDYLLGKSETRSPERIKLSDEDISFMKGIKKLDEHEKKIIRNTMDYLMGVNTVYPPSNTFMCPVYGQISAGQPNWAEECLEGYLPIDPNLMGIINPEECFFLRINGESMNKLIRNGAYALIRKQDTVENGEVAAVLVNGFDATLKKFTQQGNLIILEPCSDDSSYKTQVYNEETTIRILGKYIGKFEMN